MTGKQEKALWNRALPRRVLIGITVGLILIASFFALIVVPARIEIIENARYCKAEGDLSRLCEAVDKLELDHGRYPTESEGLKILVKPTKNKYGWMSPYLQAPMTNDPWGHPYLYQTPGANGKTGYLVESYGADGQPGGAGDGADIIYGSD